MPQSSIGFNWELFGQAVKSIRAARGQNIRDFASTIPSISHPTLNRIERGVAVPAPTYLTVCRALNIDPFDALDMAGKTLADVRALEDA